MRGTVFLAVASPHQPPKFFVEVRDGGRFVGYLKVHQVPQDLHYLLKESRYPQECAEGGLLEHARLIASRLMERRSLP
jgi:hypothetical protein